MTMIYILLWMIFNHVFDDYFLQGILATLKQKNYWIEECAKQGEHFNHSIYKNDYKMALAMHSFSWTFMIMLPLIVIGVVLKLDAWFILSFFVINCITHYVVDDAKANHKTINLVQDQSIHIFQIIMTWVFFYITQIV